MKDAERWTVHTRRLPPLAVSHHVRIQNQTGPYPNKWDKTGIIIEVRQFDQYVVRVDGSGRITLCKPQVPEETCPCPSTTTLGALSMMTSDTLLSCLPSLLPHPPCSQPPACPLLQLPTSQPWNPPLAKAPQAQFQLPLPQLTSALGTLKQQSPLHLVFPWNHHQRLLWSPISLSPPHHPLLRAH